jgi:hypothetical protein
MKGKNKMKENKDKNNGENVKNQKAMVSIEEEE